MPPPLWRAGGLGRGGAVAGVCGGVGPRARAAHGPRRRRGAPPVTSEDMDLLYRDKIEPAPPRPRRAAAIALESAGVGRQFGRFSY